MVESKIILTEFFFFYKLTLYPVGTISAYFSFHYKFKYLIDIPF